MFINLIIPDDDRENLSHEWRNKNFSIRIPEDLSSDEINAVFYAAKENLLTNTGNPLQESKQLNDVIVYTIEEVSIPNAQILELSHFYTFNKWVSIRSGVYDRYLHLNSSHYSGRITDFYNDGEQDIFFIKWSKDSLERIPATKLQHLFRNYISPFGSYVFPDLILPLIHSEELLEFEQKQLEIYRAYLPVKFEDNFRVVFGETSYNRKKPNYIIWEDFFQKFLQAEGIVHCKYKHAQDSRLVDVAGADEKVGVWVELLSEGKTNIIPLADVQEVQSSVNIENVFQFYLHWVNYFCF